MAAPGGFFQRYCANAFLGGFDRNYAFDLTSASMMCGYRGRYVLIVMK
jgi:hypothetical protein